MKNLIKFFICMSVAVFMLVSTALANSYIINGDDVYFRSSPAIEQDNVINVFNFGEKIEAIDIYGDWYQVKHGDEIGFISAKYVDFETSSNTIARAKTKVNFREKPSTNCNTIDILGENTVFKVHNILSDWALVEYNGSYGYVNIEYIDIKNLENIDVLGCFTTFFSTGQKGRTKNIKKGASLLTETQVDPGETFSLLGAIGPINKSAGYFEAPEYKRTASGTKTVTGYGGGVCQIATTLYQTVCASISSNSRLEIVERHKHSKPVSYIEIGSDATISWSAQQDFKFKNCNSYSIKIYSFVKNGSITCVIARIP